MISTKEIFDTVQSLALKQGHGTISIPEFDKYATLASKSLFNEKVGSSVDNYKLGKAMAKSGPGMNKEVDKALSSFFRGGTEISLAAGEGPWPEGLAFVDTMTTIDGFEVSWKPKHMVPSYVKSTIDPPTANNAIYTDRGNGFKVYPSVPKVVVDYYIDPVDIKYGFTIDTVKNRPVYDASKTVNFEWPEGQRLELLTRILGFIGVSIRDTELFQIAEQQKNTLA